MAESAAYTRRGFKGGAKASTIAAGIAQGATSFAGADLSTWAGAAANGPARLKFNAGQSDEEIAEFTTLSGNAVSVLTRGVDGTTDQEHAPGCTITLVSSARDSDEANEAVAKTLGQVSVANALKVFRVNSTGDDVEVVLAGFIGALVKNNATQAVSTGAAAAVLFQLEDKDSHAFHSTVSNTSRLTIPAGMTGIHRLSFSLPWTNGGTVTGFIQIFLKVNGTSVNPGYLIIRPEELSASATQTRVVSVPLSLTAGDYVEVFFDNESGSTATLTATCTASIKFEGA